MKKQWSTKMLVTLAMMVAIQVVLCRFLSINAWNMRLGFDFIPMVVVGILYGALPAGAAGIVADVIGALLFPSGTFFPGYTVTAFLTAFTFGQLLHKKQTLPRIIVTVAITQFVLAMFLQTYWIHVQYASPYWTLVVSRIPQCVIMAVLQFVGIKVIAKTLARYQGKKA